MKRTVWRFKNDKVNAEAVHRAAQKYNIPEIITHILLNRDIAENDFAGFLTKSKKGILNPMTMADMENAAERIVKAIEDGESIAIYGDYDVDGITSTALLYDFLKKRGANVIYYIPDRFDEGYGINIMAVNKLIKSGIKLLITVDCGITAIGETEFAKLQGMDVIITDHHTCKEKIPTAPVAVVNPKRPDDEYEFDSLAGVGVAFKLAMAVTMKLGRSAGECFDEYVDLAAIGTVADVVPLVNENRIIVEKGLALLQSPKRYGIKALLEVAGVTGKRVTAETVAFALSPRLNASGRLGTAKTAVELLLTDSGERAAEIARELDQVNKERQAIEQRINDEAMEMIANDKEFDKKKVIVLAKEGWHNGVIGIVASRITERFYRPCILVSLKNGIGKGSGRSIESFNLFNALSECEDCLTTFGGHSVAAGLGINEENIAEFTKKINEYAQKVLAPEDMIKQVKIDRLLNGGELSMATARQLAALEPYGMGNEKPIFAVKNAKAVFVSAVGEDNRHLRMQIEKDNTRIACIGFGMGEYSSTIKPGDTLHVAFRLDINSYQGRENAQLVLVDIKTERSDDERTA